MLETMVFNRLNEERMIEYKSYDLLREKDLVKILVVDGLDAAGKGTIVRWIKYILKQMGVNVVGVSLPNYEATIGKIILEALMKQGLELEERCALFALNRLECVDEIKRQVEQAYESNSKETVVAFNRFSSSNLLTWAYILKSTELKDLPVEEYSSKLRDLAPELLKVLNLMQELDKDFHRLLGIDLAEQTIWIPQIDPALANTSLVQDTTRAGRVDKYEDPLVQEIAFWLYQLAAEHGIFKFKIVDQIIDGRRMKARDLAIKALSDYGIQVNESVVDNLPAELPPDAYSKDTFEVHKLSDSIVAAQEEIYNRYPKLRNATSHLGEP